MNSDTQRARQRFAEVVMPQLDGGVALARWLSGNHADAEDIVQEACARAFAAIGGYAGGDARAWFLTIVRNTAYSWLARHRPHLQLSDDDPAAAEALHGAVEIPGFARQPAPDPQAALIAAADAQALHQAVAELPSVFRETLVLREFNGLDYRQIAELTAVPIGTVMSRLARARAQLLRRLGRRRP